MTDLYDAFAVSSIQTGLLRKGYSIQREAGFPNQRFDLLVTKTDQQAKGKHAAPTIKRPRERDAPQKVSKSVVFAIDFKASSRKPNQAMSKTINLNGKSITVYYAFINRKSKVVVMDEKLVKKLKGSIDALKLEPVSD